MMVAYAWIERSTPPQLRGHANPLPILSAREVPQVRRGLAFPGRHQEAIAAQHVVLIADAHELLAFGADVLDPGWPRIRITAIVFENGPGTRQAIVDDRQVIMQKVRIGLVEINTLLEDGLVVAMERQAAGVVGARALEATGLDLQQVEAAITVGIDPFADG